MNSASRDSSNRRILLVDDEQDIVYVITLALKRAGFAVDSHTDPKEALSSFQPGDYGLALLDIRMPGINGFELAKELKKIDPKIAICYLTALDVVDEEYQQIFPNEKTVSLVKKPSALSNLVRVVERQLEDSAEFPVSSTS
jgi:two-component system, OmpR family, response regulator ChvI